MHAAQTTNAHMSLKTDAERLPVLGPTGGRGQSVRVE